jgi:hypothetical protein
MAKQFGYSGEKYGGGKRGKIVSKFFGWRLARIILFYYTKFNK